MLNGYKTVWMPSHPRVIGKSGMVYEHILKAEEKLGRSLRPEEVVHHIDKNRLNNNLDNLLVFATKADHTSFHQGKAYYLDEDGIARTNHQNICPVCGNIRDRHSVLCITCYNQQRKNSRKDGGQLTRDELKDLIRRLSFTDIGRLYGVSDNAIRKWCDSYNLPRRKKDILLYSDTDWQQV